MLTDVTLTCCSDHIILIHTVYIIRADGLWRGPMCIFQRLRPKETPAADVMLLQGYAYKIDEKIPATFPVVP